MNNNRPKLTPGHHASRTIKTVPPHPRALIDVPALAEQLGTTQRFIRRPIAEDRVPFLKIGKFVRFDQVEIDTWINSQRH